MTKEAILSEILRLPPEERLELLGEAWDAIAATPESVLVPEWHLKEIQSRLGNPDPDFISWSEVRERLRNSDER